MSLAMTGHEQGPQNHEVLNLTIIDFLGSGDSLQFCCVFFCMEVKRGEN